MDFAILPEVAVTGEAGRDVADTAVPLEGEVRTPLGRSRSARPRR